MKHKKVNRDVCVQVWKSSKRSDTVGTFYQSYFSAARFGEKDRLLRVPAFMKILHEITDTSKRTGPRGGVPLNIK